MLVERLAVERLAVDRELLDRALVVAFAAPPERELTAPDDFAREPLDFFAAVERDLVVVPPDREPDALLPPERALRLPVLLAPDALRELALELERPLPLSPSSAHLPDITRWAASATASAINEPSLLALDMAVFAALVAASAASIPASRIARRALGLALIAAAAAARPAASISRLIAALVILSTVLSLPELERDDDLEVFLLDFAIVGLPVSGRKTLQTRNGSRFPPFAAA